MQHPILWFFVLIAISNAAWSHEAKIPQSTSAAEQPNIPFPGHATHKLAAADATLSNVSVFELSVAPRSFGAPPHRHAHEDEFFYVLEGQLQFIDRETVINAATGSLITLPRGHLHGFWNASDLPAKLLLIVTPGDFESFFDEVVQKIRQNNLESPQQIGQLIAEEAHKRGVTIYPDKVPESARAFLPQ